MRFVFGVQRNAAIVLRYNMLGDPDALTLFRPIVGGSAADPPPSSVL